jgi:hypothetical protein
VTAASPALPRPPFKYDEDDDDDAGDKTIPAAALPDEIKNLRAQFAAARKNAAEKMATEPAPAASEATTTSREKVLASTPSQELTPAANNVVIAGGSPNPPRTITGETISITNKGNPMDWEEDDDDEGAKTAIAKPGELPGLAALRAGRRPVPSPTPFRPEPMDEPQASAPSLPEAGPFDDEEDFEMVRPKRTGLILALLVLAALAVGGLLVLLDIVPLPKLPGAGRKVGQYVAPSPPRGRGLG